MTGKPEFGRIAQRLVPLFIGVAVLSYSAICQPVLFDFDSLPIHTPFPISVSVGNVTGHFTGTGQGYSIQDANVMGFTPPGFAGNCIYPNSIFLSDLLIHFDQPITDFSIMYSVQELACDTSATMRVSAFMNGSFVGTNTKVAGNPGTWPVDTLRCALPGGFDSVVVHYDSHPPMCQDYGVIFMADNMWVIPRVPNGVTDAANLRFALSQNYPNPFNPTTVISYELPQFSHVSLRVFDVLGRELAVLVNGFEEPGRKKVEFRGAHLKSGVYFYRLEAGSSTETRRSVLLK